MKAITLLFFGIALATTTVRASDIRTEQIRFKPRASSAVVQGSISSRESVSYTVGAEGGQRMTVKLSPSNTQTYFNVYAPGKGPGDEAIANSGLTGENVSDLNRFDGTLSVSGEYTISVYMMRAAARRNERSDYTLEVAITGTTGEVVKGDFADGLQGGPDYYQVSTSEGGTLKLRSGPSTDASIITRLTNGTNVRNLGCRMAEGRRWCRVATLAEPGHEGWAAGDSLIEGSASSSPMPGTPGGSSSERVRFAAGTSGAELTGALAPGESRRYLLGAKNGQDLYVRVVTNDLEVYYQIFNPDGSFLLDEMTSNQEYRGQLWQSGDHGIEVINRGNSAANYNVIFGID
jgi:hypothetical protein